MSNQNIIVKFRRGSGPSYTQAAHQHLSTSQQSEWLKMLARFGNLSLEPHFTAISETEIRALEGIALDKAPIASSLSDYFALAVPIGVEPRAILAAILEWDTVETAYIEPIPSDPAVKPSDDPRYPNQGYLRAAPTGINAVFAWSLPGGDGAGQHVVDVEQGWTFNHEDLAAKNISLIHGGISDASRSHGTAVLGELCAADNAVGCIGIVPGLTSVLASSTNGSSVANAILASVAHLTNVIKDVGTILIEQQWVNWNGSYPNMIVEVASDVFDAIRLATQLGHLVVEAAGNGSHDLDNYQVNGAFTLRKGAAGFRDSGALVVGAGSAAVPHSRLYFSNFGTRVDCYGWGESVDTTFSNPAAATNLYTSAFNGTSSASPIVTGAALAVQGMKRGGTDKGPLNPATLRAILSDPNLGTRSANPSIDKIGVMPNLQRIAGSVLNIAPELYIRDTVKDIGTLHDGISSSSPDIIIRQRPVTDPQGSFGQNSGTESNGMLSEPVASGADNFGYIRIRNRSNVPANGAVASLYWSPPSTLITPKNWRLIGSKSVDVSSGDTLTVVGPFNWPRTSIPGPGHYCFIATVSHMFDMAPVLATLDPIQNFSAFIQTNNNVAWRNFDVADIRPLGPEEASVLPFMVPNPDPGPFVDMRVEVSADLPPGSRLWISMPDTIRPANGLTFRPGYQPGTINVELAASGVTVPFEAQFLPPESWLRILVQIPHKYWEKSYEVYARQLYQEIEVGRITWLLALPELEEGKEA